MLYSGITYCNNASTIASLIICSWLMDAFYKVEEKTEAEDILLDIYFLNTTFYNHGWITDPPMTLWHLDLNLPLWPLSDPLLQASPGRSLCYASYSSTVHEKLDKTDTVSNLYVSAHTTTSNTCFSINECNRIMLGKDEQLWTGNRDHLLARMPSCLQIRPIL